MSQRSFGAIYADRGGWDGVYATRYEGQKESRMKRRKNMAIYDSASESMLHSLIEK